MIQRSDTRRLTALIFVLEALAGCALGLALGGLAGLAAARLFAGSNGGWGDLIGGILGGLAGYVLGVSLGVLVAGRRLRGHGAYWASLAGSVAGAALVLLLAEPLHLNASPPLMQAALAVVPPITAALAFNSLPRRRQTMV